MTADPAPRFPPAACSGRTPLFPAGFLFRETLTTLRSRQAKLVLFFMVYAVAAMPFTMANPPEQIMEIVGEWFGRENVVFKAFLYIWLDLGLNKLIAIVGPIFGAGLIARARARGTLEIFLSKPVTPATYFLTKLTAACLAFTAIYLFGVAAGSLYFPLRVRGFEVARFLLLSFNHVFAGIFCVIFSATLSLFFRQRVTGLLASVLILFLLISFSFIGFFNPAWRNFAYLCPFFYGISLFAYFDHLHLGNILGPTAVLILFSLAVGAVGVWKASRVRV